MTEHHRLTPPGGTGGGPSGGQVLPFRRRAVKPRRSRSGLATRLAGPLAGALVVVGAPLLVTLWALASPRFALAEVAVDGTERVPAAWVRGELARFSGDNLLRLPLGEVEAALGGHPWIAGVEVSKRPPRTLAVAVVERRPAALVPVDGELWFADAGGSPIAPAAGGETAGLLLVSRPGGEAAADPGEGGGVPLALAVAAEVAAAEPEWAAGLSWVEVLSEEDARLHTAALPFLLLVRRGRFEPAALRLRELLPRLARRYPRLAAVDLRFAGRIVVRPLSGGAEA